MTCSERTRRYSSASIACQRRKSSQIRTASTRSLRQAHPATAAFCSPSAPWSRERTCSPLRMPRGRSVSPWSSPALFATRRSLGSSRDVVSRPATCRRKSCAGLYRDADCLLFPFALRRLRVPRTRGDGFGNACRVLRRASATRDGRGRGRLRREREPRLCRGARPEGQGTAFGGRNRTGTPLYMGRDGASDARRLPGGNDVVRVSAVVVSHEQASEAERSAGILLPEVDELVVVANTPTSVTALPGGARLVRNRRSLGFAANANAGIAATTGDAVIVANADVAPLPGAVATLAAFIASRPTCGVAGPQLVFPDGSWQPSRRRFPTVGGTLVRRTPLRAAFAPRERQREHYGLDARPANPVQADWMLGAFLLLRRTMLEAIDGFDEGFRLLRCRGHRSWLQEPAGSAGTCPRPSSSMPIRPRRTRSSSPGAPSGTGGASLASSASIPSVFVRSDRGRSTERGGS